MAAALCGISLVARYLRNPNPHITVRLLRAFGATIGEGTTFKGAITIDNISQDRESAGDFSHLQLGSNCYVGEEVFFDLARPITFGDNVVIAARASFITHADCNRSGVLNKLFPRASGPIEIQSGSWIGYSSVILHGVTVGVNAVVGACSLVRDAVPEATVVAGTPARVVRSIANANRI